MQLTGRELPDGSSEAFEYDGRGNVVRGVNGACEVKLRRDACGRIVEETQVIDGVSYTVAVGHDPAGRRIARTTTLGLRERVERDVAGRRRRTWLGEESLNHENDVVGRELRRSLERGGTISSEYDLMGRVTSRRVETAMVAKPMGPREPDWMGSRQGQQTSLVRTRTGSMAK